MTARAWTAADLRRRCGDLRRAVVRARVADEDEVARYWPGGAVNTETHRLGRWVFCYANLIRLMGRTEQRDADARVDAAVASALSAEPMRVTLSNGTAVAVYPKSYHALRWLDSLDRSVRDLVGLAATAQVDTSDAIKALALAPLVESLAVRLWAWVLTEGSADAPAALPFDEATTPEPPAWTSMLAPEDLLLLARAHVEVNGRRLRIISDAFPSETSSASRLSLSGFLGTAAQELGQRPATLLREWSLGEVFAQAVTGAQAHREARESAERKAG